MDTLRITGNTYRIRRHLRRAGWTWDRSLGSWTKNVDAEIKSLILRGGAVGVDAMRSVDARWKGCQTLIATSGCVAKVIYTSPTYIEPPAAVYVPQNDAYAVDERGNFWGGEAIRGSAPDDLV